MRAATIAALFGEGILVTLNATKLIMYWGVTSIIIAFPTTKVCIKHEEISKNIFYAFFAMKYPYLPILNINSLFIYNNFLQYSTKNTNFVLVKILFMKKRNNNQK